MPTPDPAERNPALLWPRRTQQNHSRHLGGRRNRRSVRVEISPGNQAGPELRGQRKPAGAANPAVGAGGDAEQRVAPERRAPVWIAEQLRDQDRTQPEGPAR